MSLALPVAARRGCVVLFSLISIAACSGPERTVVYDDHLEDTTRVDVKRVEPLELTLIDSVRVQRDETGAARVPDISDISWRSNHWYVLDYNAKRALVIDSGGRIRDSLGPTGTSAPIASPRRLAFLGDTLLILDVGSRDDLRAFLPSGEEVSFSRAPHSMPASDLVVSQGSVILSFSAHTALPTSSRVMIAPSGSDSVIWACPVDRRYAESGDKGMLSMYSYVSLGVGASGRVACTQAISPVVTVLDPHRGKAASAALMSPSYRAPTDPPRSMNAKRQSEYESSWAQHQVAYPLASGFLSIYRMPRSAGPASYLIFACDSATGPLRCQEQQLEARIVTLLAPDTLLVARADDDLTLSRYRIRGKP